VEGKDDPLQRAHLGGFRRHILNHLSESLKYFGKLFHDRLTTYISQKYNAGDGFLCFLFTIMIDVVILMLGTLWNIKAYSEIS
jgi:hypothetical protein